MIDRLLNWFQKDETTQATPQTTNKAAAALMVEVAFADHDFSEQERAAMPSLLRQYANLSTEEAVELIQIAEEEVDDAVDLHQFTQYLNEKFSLAQKLDLVTVLWRIAYADQHIDKYEEHIIRRIADLLHLRHSEYMQCKHRVLN